MKGEKGGDRRKTQKKQGSLDSKVCGTSGTKLNRLSPQFIHTENENTLGSTRVSPSEETTGRFEVNQEKAL